MIKKSVSTTKPKKEKSPVDSKNKELEKILVNNFVSLQKVMVDLSGRFKELTSQISNLLELFETSAKVLAEKDFDIEKNNRENMKILEKLESVLEQNRTIARGLTLMHDKISDINVQPPPIIQNTGYLPPQINPVTQRYPQQQVSHIKPNPPMTGVGGVSEMPRKPISPNEQ